MSIVAAFRRPTQTIVGVPATKPSIPFPKDTIERANQLKADKALLEEVRAIMVVDTDDHPSSFRYRVRQDGTISRI